MATISLSGTKIPKVKIRVGNAQIATYSTSLKLKNGERRVISTAFEVNLTDVDGVTKVADLKGAELEWDVRVARATDGGSERYSIRVRIEQDGNLVEGGFFKDEGEFGDNRAHVYFDLVEFR